jgi:hypothetical protein
VEKLKFELYLFCKVELGPTHNFKMISESLHDCWATCYQVSAIGPPTVYLHAQSPNSTGREGVCEGVLRSLISDVSWSE